MNPIIIMTLLSLNVIQSPKLALSVPANYSYAYKYSAMFEDFVYYERGYEIDGFAVGYNRVADDAEYNYFSGVGGASDYAFNDATFNPNGLNISLSVLHSSTTWDSRSGGAYYVPNLTSYIGSSDLMTPVANKVGFVFNNQTATNYLFYIDMSTSAEHLRYSVSYDGISGASSVTLLYTLLSSVYVPAFTNVELTLTTDHTSDNVFLDAFYIRDMGLADGYTQGYDQGYIVGEASGNLTGYVDGLEDGTSIGYEDGYDDGYADGIALDQQGAYDEGYNDGINESFTANLGDWIVPAIIVVLLLGGAISIWSYKKREQ